MKRKSTKVAMTEAIRRTVKRKRQMPPALSHCLSIAEARTHFSRVVEAAGNGETFVVTKAGRPIATINPPPGPFVFGTGVGDFTDEQLDAIEAALSEPMTEQELARWYDTSKFRDLPDEPSK